MEVTMREEGKALPCLPVSGGRMPNPWAILCLRVRWAFWDVLAYEQDGMGEEAHAARQQCAEAARVLRSQFDPHPKLGPEAADRWIASEVQEARRDFAKALGEEQAWKEVVAGKEPTPLQAFFGEPRNWRLDRGRERRYV